MSKEIVLSARMDMLLKLAGKGKTLADVGCDHGYVSIAAVQRNAFEKAIAMDINQGALEAAKNNAKEYGVFEKIDFRLSNGFEKLAIKEADIALVAGMGGPLICDILSRNIEVAKSLKNIVLSPQSEIPEFRKFIMENGFGIEDEDMIKDEGKYYFAFRVSSQKQADYPFGKLGLKYGGILLKKKHPVLKEYLEKQKSVNLELMEKPGIKGTPKAEEFKAEYECINESMECF